MYNLGKLESAILRKKSEQDDLGGIHCGIEFIDYEKVLVY